VSVLALGGDQLPPFSPAAVLTQAQPVSTAALLLLLAAGLYVWGVVKLRGRGDRWPAGRIVVFLLGLGVLGLATLSGIEAYDDTLLSVHMVQHMLLSMVGPILLALGAPVTLALRTAPVGVRRVLMRVLHSAVAKVLTFPLVNFGLFVVSPFVLYFSGLYRETLSYAWVHDLVHVHFVIVGCLFFWPLLGIDPLPGRMSYPLRALLMFLSTPFHTVLGLTVMQSAALLAGDWYPSLGLAWANPYDDQKVAGGILWAGGEFTAVAMLGALVFQWMRASDKEARRIDRALDRAEAVEAAQLAAAERANAALAGAALGDAAPAGAPLAGAERAGVELGARLAGAAGGPSEAVGSAGSYEAETHR
jgi:cytochrome c oxidase assembly factor CtaG